MLIPFTISNSILRDESSLKGDEFLICPAHPFRCLADQALWHPVMGKMHLRLTPIKVGCPDLGLTKSDIYPIVESVIMASMSVTRMYAEEPFYPFNDLPESVAPARFMFPAQLTQKIFESLFSFFFLDVKLGTRRLHTVDSFPQTREIRIDRGC
jgi:hypothetical protein